MDRGARSLYLTFRLCMKRPCKSWMAKTGEEQDDQRAFSHMK